MDLFQSTLNFYKCLGISVLNVFILFVLLILLLTIACCIDKKKTAGSTRTLITKESYKK